MNAIGIICEYNPFHLGHARMLEGLRRQYDAPLVCAMSGNFVQRGDAAVAHKHARGEMAVRCGADLVLELQPMVQKRQVKGRASRLIVHDLHIDLVLIGFTAAISIKATRLSPETP